jgi:hypothetical protein
MIRRFERVDRRFEHIDTRFNWVMGLLFAVLLGMVSSAVGLLR